MRVISKVQSVTRGRFKRDRPTETKASKQAWLCALPGYNIAQKSFFSLKGFSEEGTGVTKGSSLA